jgi:hypothetical protein
VFCLPQGKFVRISCTGSKGIILVPSSVLNVIVRLLLCRFIDSCLVGYSACIVKINSNKSHYFVYPA